MSRIDQSRSRGEYIVLCSLTVDTGDKASLGSVGISEHVCESFARQYAAEETLSLLGDMHDYS